MIIRSADTAGHAERLRREAITTPVSSRRVSVAAGYQDVLAALSHRTALRERCQWYSLKRLHRYGLHTSERPEDNLHGQYQARCPILRASSPATHPEDLSR